MCLWFPSRFLGIGKTCETGFLPLMWSSHQNVAS